MLAALIVAVALLCGSAAQPARRPDLIFILVDDLGAANLGYKRDPRWPGNNETQTPNIDSLAASGLILDRHYVYKLCSPTRSALQTGRNPIHVNVLNSPIQQHNPLDPQAGFQGAARDFTGLAEKLREQGYITAQVGKWNAGMALHKQTPAGRGARGAQGRHPSCFSPPHSRTHARTRARTHARTRAHTHAQATTRRCTTTTTTLFFGTTPTSASARQARRP